MDWSILISILGAIGGLEGIRFIINRKPNKRMANTEASSGEFKFLQEQIEFAQRQNLEMEKKYAEQTERLRKTQDDAYELQNSLRRAEVALACLRCDDEDCPYRKPPTAKTPPPPGIPRDEWHKIRIQNPQKDEVLHNS